MNQSQRQYYQKIVASCKNSILCHDRNIQTLISKEVVEMTDNEYEMFQSLVQNCDTLNPCKLFQCEFINGKDKSSLSKNEIDFSLFCKEGCLDYSEKYYPTKKQKMQKASKVSFILLGSFCTLIFCSFMLLQSD